ncbi:peter pan-related [Holotrichia oblita]|uniref:Peter pan-related n=1 Tax=Holotrichia oblita TaxID=644536 RepID=A0ACB9SPZ1_HOLOL|nr:peter pan-related [Holotrichia oblita]
MGKRKRGKGRCVRKNTNVHTEPEEYVKAPHSFVIHKGVSGGYVEELTKDFRNVMEPFHSQRIKGMYLKIARLPRGPTLTFKIHEFSLTKDVVSSLKKQIVVEEAFKHSPLIVLNSFSGEGMQMKLMASMFQNMFPTINLTTVDLNTVRRCVLLNYNPVNKLIDFRHYNIKVAPVGISKGVKKVVQGKIPDLSRCNDISDLLTKSGLLSESEMEDDPNSHVVLGQKIISRGNVEQGKSAIRLTELGPRLTLQLIKIEDGLMDGEVLYHDLIFKSEEEKEEIQKKRELKRTLKWKRKRIQNENQKKKEAIKQELKEKSLKGMRKNETETDRLLKKTAEEARIEEQDDDVEYYKEEVGEAPDRDLFTNSQKTGTKRPPKTFHNYKNKRIKLDRSDGDKIVGRAFRINKRIAKKGGVDKTNSRNRDFRPIGGANLKGGVRKFKSTGKKVKLKK